MPIKISWKTEIFSILVLAVSLVLGWYFYNHFPEQVVTHWNFNGEPDDYSGKFFGAFGLPLILLGIYLLFLALPYLDPKRERYTEFSGVYQIFKNLILTVMFALFVITGLYNLGHDINIGIVVPVMIGVLFVVL